MIDALSSIGVDRGVEPLEEGAIDVVISERTGFLFSACFAGVAAAVLRLGRAGCIFSIFVEYAPAAGQKNYEDLHCVVFVAVAGNKQRKGRHV